MQASGDVDVTFLAFIVVETVLEPFSSPPEDPTVCAKREWGGSATVLPAAVPYCRLL